MGSTEGAEVGWYGDPFGRHEERIWDGHAWTERVRDRQQESTDVPKIPVPRPFTARDIRRFRRRLALLPFVLAAWLTFCAEVLHTNVVGMLIGVIILLLAGLGDRERRRRWSQTFGRTPPDLPLDSSDDPVGAG